eukprot:CAMPEP_0171268400 /NCGR_PEP_ID=MMETSP0790-20130122/59655_1 /TAXON_ID=2925 /ORGANISM="Alexandrium catenella, Strain OF101" /LENGTH=33 /DNA_ID= /DNA_START= /DNA_END= /DNA_ORIENTATION=
MKSMPRRIVAPMHDTFETCHSHGWGKDGGAKTS